MDRLGTMETFVRVVETGSFSAAARDLKIGQPAVSKSIALLEERFGVRLLMRSTRGLTPTEAGQDFYERARKIIDEARDADIAVSGAAGGLSGRLRVSAGVTIARLHIVPRLHVFLEQYPNLALDLFLSDRTGDLIQEGVDISFRAGVLSDSSVIARKVATSSRLVVGTPAFFEQEGVPKTPTDLSRYAAVIYTMERIFPSPCRGGCVSAPPRGCGPRFSAASAMRSLRNGCLRRSLHPVLCARSSPIGTCRRSISGPCFRRAGW